jgi:hypothetical protein
MANEVEISLEVNDDRLFAGLWNYLVVAYWGGTNDGGPVVDILVDRFSLAPAGAVVITAMASFTISGTSGQDSAKEV